jgi:hypothetical protein
MLPVVATGDSRGKPAGVLVGYTGDLASHYARTGADPSPRPVKTRPMSNVTPESAVKTDQKGCDLVDIIVVEVEASG